MIHCSQEVRERMAKVNDAADRPTDRRRAPRRQPAVGTVFCADGDPTSGRGFGLVWNISTSGISMLTPQCPNCGDVIRGQIVSGDGRHQQAIVFEVVHRRQIKSGDHFLGGQFQSPLTDEQIRPFLFE
jgi:hypothetical protein